MEYSIFRIALALIGLRFQAKNTTFDKEFPFSFHDNSVIVLLFLSITIPTSKQCHLLGGYNEEKREREIPWRWWKSRHNWSDNQFITLLIYLISDWGIGILMMKVRKQLEKNWKWIVTWPDWGQCLIVVCFDLTSLLSLSANPISAEGAVSIGIALKVNSTLLHLE